MAEQVDWQAFRACDAMVEQAIAEGAYRKALDHLVQCYQRVILSSCRKQLGSIGSDGRAEEIAHEVFLTAYRVMPRKEQTPVRPWLFAIVRKRCWRELRDSVRQDRLRHTREDMIRSHVHREGTLTPEEHALSDEQLDHLRRSLMKLRIRSRELITQRFLEGYTLEMLAREYFCSEGTIRDRLNKALAQLQVIYRQLSGES